MNFSRTLASGMEVSDYFAPAITVIELAQETSICDVSQVDPLDYSIHEGIKEEDSESIW